MLYCSNCYEPLDNAYEPCQKCGTHQTAPSRQIEKESLEKHPSFPQVASYKELTGSKAKSKKKYLVVASLFALLFLAREIGFVNWYLFHFDINSKTQVSLYGNHYAQSGDDVTYTDLNKNIDSTFTTKGHNYGLGFTIFGDSPLIVDLQEEIQNNLKSQPQATAHLEGIELTGTYWLPFFKSGNCKYRVRLQVVGRDSVVYTGILNGETEFDYSGICSVRTLKQTLGSEIATKIIKSVDSIIH